MSLIPRWEYLIDDAKATIRRVVLSALVLLLSLWVVRVLVPWVIISLLGIGHLSICRKAIEMIRTTSSYGG